MNGEDCGLYNVLFFFLKFILDAQDADIAKYLKQKHVNPFRIFLYKYIKHYKK